MKKITFLLFIAFALSFTWQSNAQVTVGDGTYNNAFNTYPFNPYYGYSYAQSIYLASEINASGDITAITFEMVDADAIPNSDDQIDLWIGHTTKTEFTSITDWVDVATLTQVMTNGALTKSGTTITFTFSAPFTYNGTDNLIIALDANEASYDTSADKLYGTNMSQNRTIRHMDDTDNYDPAAPGNGTLTTYIGNATFIGITQTCPAPSGMTASNVTSTSAELNWTAGGGETQWQLEWKAGADFTPGTGTMDGSAGPNPDPTYTATGLTPDTMYYIYYRADCGGGDTSAWVGPFTGTTLVSCGEPTALLANPSDVTSIISWTAPTAGTPTGYNWEVQPDGVAQGTAGAITGNIADITDTVSGLTAATPYDLFVQTDCGAVDGTSTWVGPYSFTTNSVPPPANDECSGAIALTVNTDFLCGSFTSGTNLGATASSQVDDATGTPDDDVWYSFVATSADHRITLTNVVNVFGTGVDMVMAVYDGTTGCSSLVYQGSSDPNTYNISGLTVSNNYFVRVFGYYSGTSSAQTTFDICVGRQSTDTLEYYNLQWPPSGTITDGDGYNVYAQCYEAGLTDVTSGQAAGVECWIGYSSTDTDPSGTGWTWVAATFDSEAGNNDQYILDLDASVGVGTYYYASRWSQNLGPYTYGGIQADGSYGGTWGADNNISGMLTVNAPPPPANDNCAGAISVTVGIATCGPDVTGTNVSATDSGVAQATCATATYSGGDIWYTFDMPAGETSLNYSRSASVFSTTQVELYDGTCGALTEVDCSTSATDTFTGLTAGGTYYLRLYDWSNDNFGDVTFCLGTPPPPPANDDCSTATVVATLPFNQSMDATSATNAGFVDCNGNGMNDGVWYTFTTVAAGTVDIAITGVTGWDAEVAIYSGSCGTFTCVDRVDSGGTSGSETLTGVAVEAATQYWINIGYYSGTSDSSEGPFTIDVSTADTTTLSLDELSFNNFKYFPNPVEGTLSLRAQDNMQNIAVYNMLGQEVINISPNTMSKDLDMSALSRGTYFVRVSINGAVENFKVIKE